MNIKKYIKRLFCKHEYRFVKTISSDIGRYYGKWRSVWQCEKCGKYVFR